MKFLLLLAACCLLGSVRAAEPSKPNILWITSEDNGPMLGCYGDKFATTPRLDALAAKGLRYLHAWSVAPVCAPARTTIISGMYPSSTGAEHMRSEVKLPDGKQMFPQYLRAAGYYCTNNAKEDYNLTKPAGVWDVSSAKAHYKNRASGQPFFAVFNILDTHESQARKRPHTFVHDPAKVTVPPYHPDNKETRESWAQYYDQMSVMDRKAGELLDELEASGLAQDTIVFYYGDHGTGLPRCKRTPCDSGLHVPFIVHFPDKWKHLAPKDYVSGGASERLISFVDLAPTVLSIAGVEAPNYLQGLAFAGTRIDAARPFNYGLRGRMDERIDLVRSVSDGRYVYLRNYLPQKPKGQYNDYMFQTPMTVAWEKLYREGKLPPPLAAFWQPKAAEELYDLTTDPGEIKNLAGDPAQAETLAKFRAANRAQLVKIRDVGLMPEAEMHARAGSAAPFDFAQNASAYPVERILSYAEAASLSDETSPPLALQDPDSLVRYWSVQRLLIQGAKGVASHETELLALLKDTCPSVCIAAAEAVAKFGAAANFNAALDVLLSNADVKTKPYFAGLASLNAIDDLDEKAKLRFDAIKALSTDAPGVPKKFGDYMPRLLEKTLLDLKGN